jgi:hypothetical protein
MKFSSAKATVAAAGTFITVLATAFSDDVFGGEDYSNIGAGLITLALTVYAVWRTPNKPI